MSECNSQSGDTNEFGVDTQVDKSSNDGQKFAWNTSYQNNEQNRISIKEAALKDGIEQCEKLISEIKQSFSNIERLDDEFARSIWSPGNRKEWILNCGKYPVAGNLNRSLRGAQRTLSRTIRILGC
jgi:hypothetical protein